MLCVLLWAQTPGLGLRSNFPDDFLGEIHLDLYILGQGKLFFIKGQVVNTSGFAGRYILCIQVPPLSLSATVASDRLVDLSLPQFYRLYSGLKAPSDREILSEVEINFIICKAPYEWALA